MSEFKLEEVKNLREEIYPLLKQHWKEISAFKEIPLSPNFDMYEILEDQGRYKIYTARDNGALVGYAGFFLNHNLHYQESFQAVQDVIYLEPSYRGLGIGPDFIKYCEDQLKDNYVELIYHHVKTSYNFGSVLEDLGYDKVEYIYAKKVN